MAPIPSTAYAVQRDAERKRSNPFGRSGIIMCQK